MNILIVEDEPTSLKLTHVVLEAEGNSVHNAGSAEEALKAVTQHRPDLIILDLRLPGISGLELTRQLKANSATAHIPILAVTFYPGRFTREEALAAGCDAYFVKPIDTRELPKAVQGLAGRKSTD